MPSVDFSFIVSTQQKKNTIVDEFCSRYGFDPSTGMTKDAFMKKTIASFILSAVKSNRVEKKAQEAANAEAQAVDSSLSLD